MKRRHLLAAGIGALAAPAIARADAKYPDRTIRLIVPFPAGGATDIVGRMFADKLTHQLGQTVIVDNKGGAAGSDRNRSGCRGRRTCDCELRCQRVRYAADDPQAQRAVTLRERAVHITYAAELERESLQQGDVLLRTASIDALLKEIHPHYTKEDYRYLMVLTQTCDLVRRLGSAEGKRCKARYISVAAVRPLERVIAREWICFVDHRSVEA